MQFGTQTLAADFIPGGIGPGAAPGGVRAATGPPPAGRASEKIRKVRKVFMHLWSSEALKKLIKKNKKTTQTKMFVFFKWRF